MTRSEINAQRERILCQPNNPRGLSVCEINTMLAFLTSRPCSYEAVALFLKIAPCSAKTFMTRVREKLYAHDMLSVAQEALKLGYLTPEQFANPTDPSLSKPTGQPVIVQSLRLRSHGSNGREGAGLAHEHVKER